MRSVVLRGVFVAFLIFYPLVVYFGIRVLPASFFGVLLAVLILPRVVALRGGEYRLALSLMSLLLAYAIAATIYGRTQALLYYPVLVNLTMCALFSASLRSGEPLLLRLVRSRGMTLSEHAPRYLARLTGVWAVFFAVNGLIGLWTTTQSLEVWTLYNALISYLLVGALVGGEWMFRRRYKRVRGVT